MLSSLNSCVPLNDQDAIDRVEKLLKSGSLRVTNFKVENEEKTGTLNFSAPIKIKLIAYLIVI
jgi:hypothetical protein